MLRLDGVHAGYGESEVLKGISLVIEAGEVVTLIGANGAGKTTTLMTICGIVRARQGRITFEGRDIHGLPPHEIVRSGIAQSPEGRKVFPRLTVQENLEMGAFTRTGVRDLGADFDRTYALFPILAERRRQAAGSLSGGEQQMLAVGRALMARPKLLLLDEPSLGLAPQIVLRIFDVLRELNRAGTTLLVVEQNARLALRLAHRGYVMETGRITLSDAADRLLVNEQVRSAYLAE
jgi:branched-chain amino acid transport system ATP-binding protein